MNLMFFVYKNLKKIAVAFGLVMFFFLIVVLSRCNASGVSYTFIYPMITDVNSVTTTDKVETEKRFLPENPVQGEVRLYIEELLLGPQTHRLAPIFSYDATVEFCFVEKSVLYLGISEDSILKLSDNVDIDSRIALFEKNIKKNFKNIEKIVLFIGGEVVNE